MVKEPFFLSIEQIETLTPWQVKYLYLRPKNLQGRDTGQGYTATYDQRDRQAGLPDPFAQSKPSEPMTTEKQMFFDRHRSFFRLPEHQIQKLWEEHLSSQPVKKK